MPSASITKSARSLVPSCCAYTPYVARRHPSARSRPAAGSRSLRSCANAGWHQMLSTEMPSSSRAEALRIRRAPRCRAPSGRRRPDSSRPDRTRGSPAGRELAQRHRSDPAWSAARNRAPVFQQRGRRSFLNLSSCHSLCPKKALRSPRSVGFGPLNLEISWQRAGCEFGGDCPANRFDVTRGWANPSSAMSPTLSGLRLSD